MTASEGRLEGLEAQLEGRGHAALRHPFVATDVIYNRGAAERISALDWWLFPSRTAVEAWVANGLGFRAEARVGAVGPGTAATLREVGAEVAAIGDPATAVGLAKAVIRHSHCPRRGDSIGAVVGNRARSALRMALALHGVTLVTAELYRSFSLPRHGLGSVDAVVLASPSAVAELPTSTALTALLIAIGPTTAQAVRRRGWVAFEATEPTVQGVVDALELAHLRRHA